MTSAELMATRQLCEDIKSKKQAGTIVELLKLSEILFSNVKAKFSGQMGLANEDITAAIYKITVNFVGRERTESGEIRINADSALLVLQAFAKLGKLGLMEESSPGGKPPDGTAQLIDACARQVSKCYSRGDRINANKRIKAIYNLGVLYPDSITVEFFNAWQKDFFYLSSPMLFDKITGAGRVAPHFTKLLHGLTQKALCSSLDSESKGETTNILKVINEFVGKLLTHSGEDLISALNGPPSSMRYTKEVADEIESLRNQLQQSSSVFPALKEFIRAKEIDVMPKKVPEIDERNLQHKLAMKIKKGLEGTNYEVVQEWTNREFGMSPVDIAIVRKGTDEPVYCIEVDGKANHSQTRLCRTKEGFQFEKGTKAIDLQKDAVLARHGVPVLRIQHSELIKRICGPERAPFKLGDLFHPPEPARSASGASADITQKPSRQDSASPAAAESASPRAAAHNLEEVIDALKKISIDCNKPNARASKVVGAVASIEPKYTQAAAAVRAAEDSTVKPARERRGPQEVDEDGFTTVRRR